MAPEDYGVLVTARFFFLSFANPDAHGWMTALLGADDLFGRLSGKSELGAEIVRRTLAVVQDMRLSRRAVLRFSNPRCASCAQILTHDERHLIQMVQALRRGDRSVAASSAMLLCEGNPIDDLLSSARWLADGLGAPVASRPVGGFRSADMNTR
jgi:hypothetical protein